VTNNRISNVQESFNEEIEESQATEHQYSQALEWMNVRITNLGEACNEAINIFTIWNLMFEMQCHHTRVEVHVVN
jgi:hypothetical protein